MKKLYSVKLLLCALLLAIGCNAWGAEPVGTVLWADNFGTQGATGTDFSKITSNLGNYDYSGRSGITANNGVTWTLDGTKTDVRVSNASGTGYTDGHLWFLKQGQGIVTTSAINVGGATAVTLGFTKSKSKLIVSYSTDGSIWTPIFTESSATAYGDGKTVDINNLTAASIYLKFQEGNNSNNCRVDNISLVVKTAASSEKHSVTFNVGDHGEFANGETFDAGTTNKRTEASAGDGVTLPDVDANDGFKFLGWTATEGKTTIDAGLTAGATYKPFEDIELYAVYGKHYQVTIVDPENGTLSVKCGEKDVTSGEYYAVGEVLNIVATPATGYKFRNIQVVDASTHTFTASNTKDWGMGDHEITIKANFDEIVYRTITWSVNGNTSVIDPSKVEDGTNITFPTGLEDILGKKFMGWSANSAANSANDLVSGDIAASESTTLFYAVYADAVKVDAEWQKITNVNQVVAGTYALISTDAVSYVPNAAATNSCPVVVAVTKANGKITVQDAMKWTVTGDNTNGYNFESVVETGKFLWGGSANDGTRVNTTSGKANATKNWFVKSINTYGVVLYNKATSGGRYLKTNGSTDWRNYDTNPDNTNRAANLYKLVDGFNYSNYTTTLSGIIDFRASDESGAYWATYSGAYNVVIPAEDENALYNVYAVAYENEALVMFDFASDFNNVDAQSNPIVPANVGVLVKAVAKPEKTVSALTYTVSATAGENYDAEYNSLYPASKDKEDLTGHKFYKLAYASSAKDNLGFYWGAENGGAFTSREGSAYLAVPAGTLAPARFIFGQQGVPTELQTVSAEIVSRKVMIDGCLYILRDGKTYDSLGRMVK